MCILFIYDYTHAYIYIVKSCYDLSVLSMSMMGLKKNWMWVGGVSSIQVYF